MTKITLPELANGIFLYAENEVLPVLDGWQIWLAGAGIALFKRKAETIIMGLGSNKLLQTTGIIDSEGLIDIDLLYEVVRESANKYGEIEIDASVFGKFKFTSKDVNALYKTIKDNAKHSEKTEVKEE